MLTNVKRILVHFNSSQSLLLDDGDGISHILKETRTNFHFTKMCYGKYYLVMHNVTLSYARKLLKFFQKACLFKKKLWKSWKVMATSCSCF